MHKWLAIYKKNHIKNKLTLFPVSIYLQKTTILAAISRSQFISINGDIVTHTVGQHPHTLITHNINWT